MKLILQKVNKVEIKLVDKIIKIGKGLMIFINIRDEDNERQIDKAVEHFLNIKLFENDDGKWKESVKSLGLEIILISQFIKYNKHNVDDGNINNRAKQLFNQICLATRKKYGEQKVKVANYEEFQTTNIEYENPVSIVLRYPIKNLIQCECKQYYEKKEISFHLKNCQKIFDKYWEFDLKIGKTLKKFCNSKESLIIASILLEKFIKLLREKVMQIYKSNNAKIVPRGKNHTNNKFEDVFVKNPQEHYFKYKKTFSELLLKDKNFNSDEKISSSSKDLNIYNSDKLKHFSFNNNEKKNNKKESKKNKDKNNESDILYYSYKDNSSKELNLAKGLSQQIINPNLNENEGIVFEKKINKSFYLPSYINNCPDD